MKTTRLLLAALGASILALSSCSVKNADNGQNTEAQPAEAAPEGVIALTNDTQFRPGQAVPCLTVLDFNATWCIPCKKLTPAFDMAAETYKGDVAFYTVDIDKNPETKDAFGVDMVPCVVMISPDGSYDTYPSLNDFISEDELKTLSPDSVTIVIFDNISKKIQQKQ